MSSLPDDIICIIQARLGLRELFTCARVSAQWRRAAVARRNALRLLEHERSFGERSKAGFHHAGAMALADEEGSILVCEQERMSLLSPDGERHVLWGKIHCRPPAVPMFSLWGPGWGRGTMGRGASGPCGVAVMPEDL